MTKFERGVIRILEDRGHSWTGTHLIKETIFEYEKIKFKSLMQAVESLYPLEKGMSKEIAQLEVRCGTRTLENFKAAYEN